MRKYNKFLYYDKENNILLNEKGEKISHNNIMYKILERYKIPSHLENIKVVIYKNLEDADNGLIYIGIDKNNKEQYIYGYNYVKKRNEKRLNIFLNVESKRKEIEKFINKNIYKFLEKKEKKYLTTDTIFSIVLLLELTFYIRTGKKKFLEENNTTGIMTLKKKNILIDKNNIIINFIGKVKKEQSFILQYISHPILYELITLLYKFAKNDEDFIFINNKGKELTERKLYYRMNNYFNIRFKDLRTYGVNNILIKELYKEINLNDPKTKTEFKKLISRVINSTADIIGHTSSISKSSYIIQYLLEKIKNLENIVYLAHNLEFDNFYEEIIKMLKRKK